MSILKTIVGTLIAVVLSACGGGGGDAGGSATSGTGTSSGGTTSAPTLTLVMQSAATAQPVQAIAASATNVTQLVATLTTATGVPIAGQVVTFNESPATSLSFFPGGSSKKTGLDGVATVTVQRVNQTTFGSGSFYATAGTYSTTSTTSSTSVPIVSNYLTFRADPPAFQIDLRDVNNAVTTSIGSNLTTSVHAVLQFEDGTPVTSKAVYVSDASGKVSFPSASSATTGAASSANPGVAIIPVTRASLSVNGAGTLNVSSTISGSTSSGSANNTVVAGTVDYQLGTANIALSGLSVGSTALSAYGNRTVSVSVTSNGTPVTIPVQVTFGASCGVVSPLVVATDANGLASTTYTASDPKCAGTNVSITAAATGATTQSGTIAVSAPVATNVQFVSAAPQLIYLSGTVGTTQAQVVFKVVDSSGNAVQNKTLQLALINTATGVSLGTLGNTTPLNYVSDSSGNVSAAVFSGTVPTSMTVRATLLDSLAAPTSIYSDSNILTVASGRPTQSSLSLASAKTSIEGANIDNVSTTLTLSMADRNGNPVPPGTQVNFVSEAGVVIPAVCFVPPAIPATANSPAIPSSSCSVTLFSSGTRTANGNVAVMAYVAGDEDFSDLVGDNVYHLGDPFTDLGRAYLDKVGAGPRTVPSGFGVYNNGEFQVPRIGDAACLDGASCPGDGLWGSADVRKQITIVFATSSATISAGSLQATSPLQGSTDLVLNSLNVTVADLNGNSMPTGTQIAVTAVDNGFQAQGYLTAANCQITSGTGATISNSLSPILIPVTLKFCTPGDAVQVTVTSPLGIQTQRLFTIY